MINSDECVCDVCVCVCVCGGGGGGVKVKVKVSFKLGSLQKSPPGMDGTTYFQQKTLVTVPG